MGTVLIETAKDDITGICLQYIVLATRDMCAADPELSTVYSLIVIKTEGQYDREALFVYDISRCYDRAVQIARVMSENIVTPCSVREVLDDIL